MSSTTVTITLRVTCIRKRGNHLNPHERIEAIGGLDANGVRYRYLEDDAIRRIQFGINKFWTVANGVSVWVEVAERNGRKYLKTHADKYEPNNLLALPDCT